MPRPCKRRRICALPGWGSFGPKDREEAEHPAVTMMLDEFESIRLIDLEGMTQEQCAAQMGVARSTAQAIYSSARTKLAECLVGGRELNIQGGDYMLCAGDKEHCSCGHRCRCPQRMKHQKEGGIVQMKIAVTVENGQVFQHFGHTEHFQVYEVENGKVTAAATVGTDGSGHGALADLLKQIGVDTLICGGIGGGARQALDEAGIRIYGGVTGDADGAVEALLGGSLRFDPDAACSHHGDEHDHGGHSCGGHHHGGHH